MRTIAGAVVIALAAAWYAAVVYVTWPYALAFVPLWVLAGVIVVQTWERLDEWWQKRQARRNYSRGLRLS